jgi:DNA polymerase
MFIGEAPGAEEDRTGRPFVGRAGHKLDDMIRAMGLQREDVYIANILKSRPPNNRTPRPDEIADCSPYLARQIAIIQPEALVALGNPSMKFLLQTDQGITRMRGQWASYRSPDGREIPVMPTFHPAYLLRNYTREVRERVWSDLKAVMNRLEI